MRPPISEIIMTTSAIAARTPSSAIGDQSRRAAWSSALAIPNSRTRPTIGTLRFFAATTSRAADRGEHQIEADVEDGGRRPGR